LRLRHLTQGPHEPVGAENSTEHVDDEPLAGEVVVVLMDPSDRHAQRSIWAADTNAWTFGFLDDP